MKTFIEEQYEAAVASNTTALALEKSCDLFVQSGPVRLANTNPQSFVGLAVTALQGSSTKECQAASVAGTPATITLTHTAAVRMVGVLITVTGSLNACRRGPVHLSVQGTGMTTTQVVCYPRSYRSQFIVICTQDNGGVGQVAAPTGVTVVWTVTTQPNPGVVGAEYVFASEPITLRDFTSRVPG